MDINKVQVAVTSEEEYLSVVKVFAKCGVESPWKTSLYSQNCNEYQTLYIFNSYLYTAPILSWNTNPIHAIKEGYLTLDFKTFMATFGVPKEATKKNPEITFEFEDKAKELTFFDVPVKSFYKDADGKLCLKISSESRVVIALQNGDISASQPSNCMPWKNIQKIYQVTKINFD